MKVYLGVHHQRLGPLVVGSTELADVERLDLTPWDAYEIDTDATSVRWVSGRARGNYPQVNDQT